MDKTKALQNLLKGKATKKEIELLKQALASGEISIGGDVKHSIVITGDGNNISLTPEALNLLKPETTSEEPVEGEPPYMGLRYFDTSDADLFYGREALTRELLVRVQKESFLAIVGASGSGKSSVARAGLIPAWKQENERGAIYVITPTAHPLESLAASLTRESESVTATATLMDDLKNDLRSLRLYVKKSLGETKLLLLVDQFEETFTLCKDADERKAFIENLLTLADDDSARVVITLRADFYAHCAEYEGLRLALDKHQKYIGAMTPDELRQAITAPAQSAGWDFQPGLVDLILQDVGTEPGALPLLSHALLETWKRRQGHMLTLKGYADAGGVKKAIAQTAESVYDKLTPAEQTIARGIFLRLTELGEGTQDTRRRVKMDELAQTKEQESVAKVLKTLTDARLVTTEQDSAEVSHEALIREWGTLRKWLDEDRESLRLHRHLTESAQEWERRGKEAGELYRGARLKGIQAWMKDHSNQLSPLEGDFVKASQNVKKQEIWRWTIVIELGAVFVLMILLAQLGVFDRFVYQPLDMENYWADIPAGDFQMGIEPKIALAICQKYWKDCDIKYYQGATPVHTVYLDAFEMGRYEISNRQYISCIKAGICSAPLNKTYNSSGYGSQPVTDISWDDAQVFCNWVGGRLPTEAEWEKAARGGLVGKAYPLGDAPPTCKNPATTMIGNVAGHICMDNSFEQIGTSDPNGYGLYDMAGNVKEWVNDWYSEDYYRLSPFKNPNGSEDRFKVLKVVKVVRDIARGDAYEGYNLAVRSVDSPDRTSGDVGFRCARDISPSQIVEKFGSNIATEAALTANVFAQKDAKNVDLTVTAFCHPHATSVTTPSNQLEMLMESYRQTEVSQTCQPSATSTPTSTPMP